MAEYQATFNVRPKRSIARSVAILPFKAARIIIGGSFRLSWDSTRVFFKGGRSGVIFVLFVGNLLLGIWGMSTIAFGCSPPLDYIGARLPQYTDLPRPIGMPHRHLP